MALSFTVTTSVSPAGGETYNSAKTYTGNTLVRVDDNIIANQTDSPVSCEFVADDVVVLSIVSDKDCSLQTNNAVSPVDTIPLVANIPLVWDSVSSYFDNPFTEDVTAIFITNTTALRLRIDVLTT